MSRENNNTLVKKFGFGVSFAEFTDLFDELDAVKAEREEWEAKPALLPELEVWIGTVRDARNFLREIGEREEERLIGYENDMNYDGYSFAEFCGFEEPSPEDAETRIERSETTYEVFRDISQRRLQNAWSMVRWSFDLLSTEQKAEAIKEYNALLNRLQKLARAEGYTLQSGKFFNLVELEPEAPKHGHEDSPVEKAKRFRVIGKKKLSEVGKRFVQFLKNRAK